MTGGASGSSSDGSAYTSTDLLTEVSASKLMEHYNSQLERAGWMKLDQGSTEVVSWSTWTFADDEGNHWGGTLIILDSYMNSERRLALLSVEKIP